MVVAALVAVATVVGVAVLAAGAVDGDAGAAGPGAPSVPGVFDAVVVFLVLCGVATVVLIVVGVVAGSDRRTARYTVQRSAGGAALLVLVFAFVLAANPFDDEVGMFGTPHGGQSVESEPLDRPTPVDPEAESGPDLDGAVSTVGVVVGVLAFLVLAALVVALMVRRNRLHRDVMPSTGDGDDDTASRTAARDRMIGLLDDAIEDLRTHPDAREAVVSAWVRLEHAFAEAGVHRRPADTPLRYLGRALRTVEASAPAVERLTDSFEAALFSTHPIGIDTQAAAVDALVSVRDELQVLSRGAAAARAGGAR